MSARNDDPWTVQKKFGFGDEDLKTSKHDEIMIWLDEKMPVILNWFFGLKEWENVNEVRQNGGKRLEEKIMAKKDRLKHCSSRLESYNNSIEDVAYKDYYQDQIESTTKEIDELLETIQYLESIDVNDLEIPEIPDIKVGEIVWEFVITSGRGNQYTVGFIDMVAYFTVPRLYFDDEKWELSIGWSADRVSFEIKSKMDSLGQLIRQIKLYQQYTTQRNWFVVSPDDSFEKQLKNQGIGFIKYKG